MVGLYLIGCCLMLVALCCDVWLALLFVLNCRCFVYRCCCLLNFGYVWLIDCVCLSGWTMISCYGCLVCLFCRWNWLFGCLDFVIVLILSYGDCVLSCCSGYANLDGCEVADIAWFECCPVSWFTYGWLVSWLVLLNFDSGGIDLLGVTVTLVLFVCDCLNAMG